jgi:SAM-dependent methyltransferase
MADQVTGFLSPMLRDTRFNAALPFVSGRVLDYGCGIGRLATKAAYDAYTGVDVDADSLEKAKAAHPDLTFMQLPRLPDGPFDAITLLAVIEYIPDRVALLKAFAARLAPGGRVVITTPDPLVNVLRRVLSPLGIVSKDIDPRPDSLPDRKTLVREAAEAGLVLERYGRFLLGLNQIAVFRLR